MNVPTLWLFFYTPAAAAGTVTGTGAAALSALVADGAGHAVVDDYVRLLRGGAVSLAPTITHVGRGTGSLPAARADGRGSLARGRCVGAGEARLRTVQATGCGETWCVDEAEELLALIAA